nr:protein DETOXIFICATION 16-like [Ipomoea batatas]
MESCSREREEDVEFPLISKDGKEKQKKWEETKAEAKKLMGLSVPLMSVNLLLNCFNVISIMFVGHLGELSLSGASIATSFATVTGYTLLNGMSCALETFCGQAYGAKHYRLLGVHTQRAMLILLLISVPLACIWANTGSILVFMGQDPEISAEAGNYASFLIPGLFAYALLQCYIRFLQAQNNVIPLVVTAGISTLVHVLSCWILVFKTGLGNKGAALATAVSYWINVMLLALYIRKSPTCKDTWPAFSKEVFSEIMKFLKLAIPSAAMLCLEYWSFEVMVLLAGILPNPQLEASAVSITLNTCAIVYMLPFGISGALSIRVSNELGAGEPVAARRAVSTGILLVIAEGILAATVMVSVHKVWGYCYSTEEEVVAYVGQMLLLLAGSHFLDGIQCVLSGAARGCGWQHIGAIINLGAYYLVGLPAAIFLAFVLHVGGKGLWLGTMVALFVQAILLAIVTWRTNWEKEAMKAANRVEDSMIPH